MINAIIFVCISIVSVALQSSLFSVMLSSYLLPDLVLSVVVYMAIKRGLRTAVLFSLFLVYLVSLNSGVEFFPYLMLTSSCFVISRYIGLNSFTGTAASVLWSMFISIGVSKVLFMFWLHWMDSYVLLRMLPAVIISTVVTSFIGLLLFRAFSYIDTRTGIVEPVYIKERHRRF